MNDEQLNRQLRAMVENAASPLSQTEVVLRASSPARKSRRDWHLTEHRLVVVAVAAVIVVVFFVPLPSLSLFNRLSHTGVTPQFSAATVPAGWVPVADGNAQISVPSNWWVIYGQADCPIGSPVGEVVVNARTTLCPNETSPGPGNYVSLQTAIPLELAHVPAQIINKLVLYRLPRSDVYDIPALKVMITVEGPMTQRILDTLTSSPRKVVLADGPAPKVPPAWRRVTFAGVSIAVPPLDIVGGNHRGVVFPRTANWAVSRIDWFGSACLAFQATAMTGNPLVVLDTDERLEQAYCPALHSYTFVQSVSNGLRIDRVPTGFFPTATAYGKCLQISGLTACPATAYPYSVLVLKVTVPGRSKPVYVSIGLARNGMIARTILYSLRAETNDVAPKFQKFERAATSTMSLPSSISAGGVALTGDELVDGTYPTLLYLDPATAVTGMMSKAQAEHDALRYDNAPGLRATGAVLATVTAPSDVPPAGVAPSSSATIGTVAWVVEVTPPSPIAENVCNNPTGPTTGPTCTVYVAHDYVVLDPTTGAFRIGLS
jgi:hypothetical protein